MRRLYGGLIHSFTLLSNQFCILRITVQLAEPLNLLVSSLLCRCLLAQVRLKVKLLLLCRGFYLDTVARCKKFVRDWTPAIALDALIPTIKAVILRLVKAHINCVLLVFLLESIVVTRGKRIDIDNATVSEDLVVDERREALAAESEPDMAARCCVEKASLRRVDTLQQLHRLTFLLEVDQIFVVLKDLDVSEGAPSMLDLFSGDNLLRLLSHLSATLLIASPRPLDLDCSNVVHGESMILEESSCERHLVCCLDKAGAEVTHALLLILSHHIEAGSEELLT